MTVREKTSLLLLSVGAVALVVGVGAQLGWPAGAITAGVLGLAGGVALGYGDAEPAPERDWLTILAEWSTAEEPGALDFEELPVPDRFQSLLEQAIHRVA